MIGALAFLFILAVLAMGAPTAGAQGFDWQSHKGTTLNLLLNNHFCQKLLLNTFRKLNR